jgi:hypothetical protein
MPADQARPGARLTLVLWAALALFLGGWTAVTSISCSPNKSGSTVGPTVDPSSTGARLRLVNVRPPNVYSLVVMFPMEQVSFGDLPGGTTTEYKSVSNGVFRYAAYRFRVADREHTQPVIDWVGESPMAGQVVEDLLAAPGVLAVDDPRLRPDRRFPVRSRCTGASTSKACPWRQKLGGQPRRA